MNTKEYPQCFIIRNKESEEAVWFIIIEDEKDDLFLKPHQQYYLDLKNVVEVTSLSEAETFGAFGVAPVGTCAEFTDWLQGEMNNIAKNKGNIMTNTNTIGGSTYPSYWLVIEKDKTDNEEFKLIALVYVKDVENNPLLPLSWWDKFNNSLHIHELDISNFNSYATHREAPEFNTKELIEYVNGL